VNPCHWAAPRLSEVFLTGGEPFLLLGLDRIVTACGVRRQPRCSPNGMLFRGTWLAMLRRMPHDLRTPDQPRLG
jgi:hypothetical protein